MCVCVPQFDTKNNNRYVLRTSYFNLTFFGELVGSKSSTKANEIIVLNISANSLVGKNIETHPKDTSENQWGAPPPG